jgi:hypothetical protein
MASDFYSITVVLFQLVVSLFYSENLFQHLHGQPCVNVNLPAYNFTRSILGKLHQECVQATLFPPPQLCNFKMTILSDLWNKIKHMNCLTCNVRQIAGKHKMHREKLLLLFWYCLNVLCPGDCSFLNTLSAMRQRRNWIKCYELHFQQLFLELSCSYLI